MKLRMTGSPGVGSAFCGSMDALEHDAMAAHAYQVELSRMRKAAEMTQHTHNRELVLNLLDVLDRRANELMQEWLGENS